MYKKLIAVIIASALSCTLFSGCSDDKTSSDGSSDSYSATTSGDSSQTQSGGQNDSGTVKLPVGHGADDGVIENGVMVTGEGKNVRAFELYGGSFEKGRNYASYINKYKEELGELINVYSMCIPTAFQYYLPTKYINEYGNEYENLLNIQSNLKGVIDVDVFDALNDHADEAIFSRTDHHWQPIGAYYAAQVFAEKAGITDFPSIDTYKKETIKNFVGTMYAFSNYDERIKNNPEKFIYYKPANLNNITTFYYDQSFENGEESVLFFPVEDKLNSYSVFLGSDEKIAKIDTDCKNGRTLVIFKDSFGNALVPFLTQSFEHIYVCDLRFFKINSIDFIKQVGATDVLFATCMFTCTGDNSNYIENLRNQ